MGPAALWRSGTHQYLTTDAQIADAELGVAQIAVNAARTRNPTSPLRGDESHPNPFHSVSYTALRIRGWVWVEATILLTIDFHVPVAALVKIDPEVHLSSTRVRSGTTSHVATAIFIEPRVPSRGTVLVAIALPNVELHAVGACRAAGCRALAVAVIVVRCVWMVWGDGIEVVVDAPFGSTVVIIELNEAP